MPDPKATKAEPSDASPPEAQLNGLLWEARADTGELTQLGGEAQAILGSHADLGKPRLSVDMFHPDDCARVAAIVARVLSRASRRCSMRASSGRGLGRCGSATRFGRLSTIPVLYLRGVSFDITDLKRAQTEFLRARARLSFLATVSRLLSESLDYETTLANVAKSAVPGSLIGAPTESSRATARWNFRLMSIAIPRGKSFSRR